MKRNQNLTKIDESFQGNGVVMPQYLISIFCPKDDSVFSGTFSKEDVGLIRCAAGGRAFELENYMAYRSADGTLALARKPDYVDESLLCYATLCARLMEAEIEANGVAGRPGAGA
jgi:hypothetical protein